MRAVGLIEVRPFDGSSGFVAIRFLTENDEIFDLPVNDEQLTLVLSYMPSIAEEVPEQEVEEEEEAEHQALRAVHTGTDELGIVPNQFRMGAYDEDDDL
jgi:hypothetical protein